MWIQSRGVGCLGDVQVHAVVDTTTETTTGGKAAADMLLHGLLLHGAQWSDNKGICEQAAAATTTTTVNGMCPLPAMKLVVTSNNNNNNSNNKSASLRSSSVFVCPLLMSRSHRKRLLDLHLNGHTQPTDWMARGVVAFLHHS